MTGPATEAFVKHYPSAAAAATARRRSRAARAAGVATPAVLGAPAARALAFARVTPAGDPDLAGMLAALARLHAMPGAGLSRFDPFRRITPRLAAAPPPLRALAAGLAAADAACGWPASSPVHGDFHPGQVLADAGGTVWLVDLDDMALAPPEADLGNLAAWLASAAPCDLSAGLPQALARVLAHRPGANPALAAHFARIALLRRALKLAARGEDWAAAQLARTP